jgi:hypothetical protein
VGIETVTRAMSIEDRTIRRLRIRILPFVFLLFVVALLDRVNIGFAALTMNKDLAITSQQYGRSSLFVACVCPGMRHYRYFGPIQI